MKDFEIGIKPEPLNLKSEKSSCSDGATLASSLALAPVDDPAISSTSVLKEGADGCEPRGSGVGNLVQALISQGKLRKTR